MNDLDINYLIQFADLSLKYFSADYEYGLEGMWESLELMRKYKARIEKLVPFVSPIVEHYNCV